MKPPSPQTRLWVIHPDLLPAEPERAQVLARATLHNPNWQREHPTHLHHPTAQALAADAQSLHQHAQTLLQRYPTARPVEILLVPCEPTQKRHGPEGIDAEWIPGAHDFDQIHLFWSNTDLGTLTTVLTHELGHHLRSFRDNGEDDRYPMTYHLLHEAAAERLVLEVHGLSALHHHKPCEQIVHSYLAIWLRREAQNDLPLPDSQNPDEAHAADLIEGFRHGGELYAPATHLMLRSGLSANALFHITEAEYLDVILPLAGTLP